MTKRQIFRVTLLQVIKRILAPMSNGHDLDQDTSLANVIANKKSS